jgi:hypothetical protein
MKTVLIVVFLIVALVIALVFARLVPGSLSFFESYTPTAKPTTKPTTKPTAVPPPPLRDGTYTIQNLRNGKNPSYGNGSSFLSPSPIDNTDTLVYMTDQNVDPSCQWKIKLEDRSKNAYSIQNVMNSADRNRSSGYSYLNVYFGPEGRNSENRIFFWEYPQNDSCRWIIKKETATANVFSLQSVFYGYDREFNGQRASFLAVDDKIFSDNAVYVSKDPGNKETVQWVISGVV